MDLVPSGGDQSRRAFLRLGAQLFTSTALTPPIGLTGLISKSLSPQEYEQKLADLPIAKLINEIADLADAFSWDLSESMFSERHRYSNYHQLLVSVSITLRKDSSTGVIHPERFELDQVADQDLAKIALLTKECKKRGGLILRFIQSHSPEEAGGETFEDRGLAAILETARQEIADGEIGDIDELLDSICCTDFFTEFQDADRMSFERFGSHFIDSLQESLVDELDTCRQIALLIDPEDATLHTTQQEFFRRIYPTAHPKADGTRTWTQKGEDEYYLSKIRSVLTGPAETLAGQIASLTMPPIEKVE